MPSASAGTSPSTVRIKVVSATARAAQFQYHASLTQRVTHSGDADFANTALRSQSRKRGGSAGCLTHRHGLRHRPDRGVRIVCRREASTSDHDILRVTDKEGSKRDTNRRTFRQVCPGGSVTGVVVFDGGGAQRNLVIKLTCTEHIFPGNTVVTTDPAGFAQSNLSAESDKAGLLVPGDTVGEEASIFKSLTTALDFCCGQSVGLQHGVQSSVVIAGDRVESSHDRCGHPAGGRDVITSVTSRQVITVGSSLKHEFPQVFLTQLLPFVMINIDHSKRLGESLCRGDVTGDLIVEPGIVAQVTITGCIDERGC